MVPAMPTGTLLTPTHDRPLDRMWSKQTAGAHPVLAELAATTMDTLDG
jgi:hypothetical protein